MQSGFSVENISFSASGRPLLTDVSLDCRPGQFTVIVGPNGAGKTTLMRLLAGDQQPTAGAVLYNGQLLQRFRPMDLAKIRAVMAQSVQINFPYTVFEVVKLGTMARSDLKPAELGDLVLQRLGDVDLNGYADRLYQSLSGGEQQRVQLARALCQIDGPSPGGQSRYLFLDEPISSLDVRHQLDVMNIARRFVDAGGSCIAILHDLNIASMYADELAVLNNGTIYAYGKPKDLLCEKTLEEVYGLRIRSQNTLNTDTLVFAPQMIIPACDMSGPDCASPTETTSDRSDCPPDAWS
ncbi:heme ABC transporter ATP-binding protein [Coralliovum pocilloporae]|uniref:heme ABC transporter ATP-binding protein n=1 Tax=Coralliovum pocilloporae TaxID=3066369 RepID=UPI0033076436